LERGKRSSFRGLKWKSDIFANAAMVAMMMFGGLIITMEIQTI
jgi:hypothetical protein